ncbi:MAG: 2-phosphosulfolactate phosphatase [Comamonadaceae bacterium]|nr:2-phosphosulfolactate phosphatase [Comamonadaceae bacterium]
MPSRANIENKSAVIIDVLRATTTIIYAFCGYRKDKNSDIKGCKKIIPVETIEEALNLKKIEKSAKLAGERFCLKPEGFDFGNSLMNIFLRKFKEKLLYLPPPTEQEL